MAEASLTFDQFWTYLQGHPNCILSAGTPEVVLYDDDDYHWHLAREGDDNHLLQVIRGKTLVGEILIVRSQILEVQGELRAEGEYLFECLVESEEGPAPGYFITVSHDYTPEEPAKPGRWVH